MGGEVVSVRGKLLATVSAAAIVLGAGSARATDDDFFKAIFGDNWYISVFGGAALNETAHSNYFSNIYQIRVKDGFTVGAAFGGEIAPGLRAEQEISYLRHENRDTRFSPTLPRQPLSGDTDAVFILANLWKDFDLGIASIYLGGGVGTAILGIDGSYAAGTLGWDASAVAFAAQLGGGVRVGLTDRLALDAGYRFKMAVDANLESGGFVNNNDATLSLYDHIFQVGVTYAMGENGQVVPADGGDPDAADWYVSLFGGAQFGEDMAVDGFNAQVFALDNKTGYTVGGAIGTHLVPGLRAELEVSYMRQAADSVSLSLGVKPPTSGNIEQVYVLANIWMDIQLGPVSPYVGAGIGVGVVNPDGFDFAGASSSWDTDGFGLAGQFGAGVRVAVTDALTLDAGYRFKGIVNAFLPGDPAGFVVNSSVATYNHILQIGLTYGLNGTSIAPAADTDPMGTSHDWYVSLFGGGAFGEETHVSYFPGDYLLDFKSGFTVGVAVGTNLLPAMRGELELSYVEVDSDTSTESGVTVPAAGDVGIVFLLANLWQDFDLGMSFTPYGGFGLGMAFADVDMDVRNNGAGIDDSSTALGAQLGGGVRFNVTDDITIDAGYRFKMALDVLTQGAAPGSFHGQGSYYTHIIQAGVGWNF